jgi:hypothetical protein
VISRIERVNLVLAVVMTALGGLLWGKAGALAAGVGAALAVVDFYVLVRLGARLVAQARAGAPSRALSFLLLTKTMILFALVFIAIRVLHLPPIPFALGFSVFVVSIFLLGLQAAKNDKSESII